MKLEEIARLSGVSRSTVSRVVNNDPNVREATRERVWRVIRRENFHPNAAARSLATGRTRVLGLVIPYGVSSLFVDPYFPSLIQGVAAATNALDHSVMLWLADPEYERRTIRQVMHAGLVDGVLIASSTMDDPVVQALLGGDLPFLLVGRHPAHPGISYVDVDNLAAARMAVTHLLRLGYRRVATVTGPLNMIGGIDRRDGYLAALRDRGLAPDSNLIVEGDFTEAGGYAGMKQLLQRQLEAVFVASDMMAVGALRAIRETGRRVPEDIALVGFDDMPLAVRTEPPLTTIRQPIHRTGAVAAQTLIGLINNPQSDPQRIILPTELIIRESCGANLRADGNVRRSNHFAPPPGGKAAEA